MLMLSFKKVPIVEKVKNDWRRIFSSENQEQEVYLLCI